MKTFTATHLNKHAQEVFAAAKEQEVFIKHDRYRDGRFVIKWEPEYKYVAPMISVTKEKMEEMYPTEDNQ